MKVIFSVLRKKYRYRTLDHLQMVSFLMYQTLFDKGPSMYYVITKGGRGQFLIKFSTESNHKGEGGGVRKPQKSWLHNTWMVQNNKCSFKLLSLHQPATENQLGHSVSTLFKLNWQQKASVAIWCLVIGF